MFGKMVEMNGNLVRKSGLKYVPGAVAGVAAFAFLAGNAQAQLLYSQNFDNNTVSGTPVGIYGSGGVAQTDYWGGYSGGSGTTDGSILIEQGTGVGGTNDLGYYLDTSGDNTNATLGYSYFYAGITKYVQFANAGSPLAATPSAYQFSVALEALNELSSPTTNVTVDFYQYDGTQFDGNGASGNPNWEEDWNPSLPDANLGGGYVTLADTLGNTLNGGAIVANSVWDPTAAIQLQIEFNNNGFPYAVGDEVRVDNFSLTQVAVPEPASIGTLGAGLVMLVLRRRRHA
jgi:hypothetical protein